jgi:cytochrome b
MQVWDALVRICHVGLICLVIAAWFSRHRAGPWHEYFGYAVAAVVLIRCVWGIIGTRHARFSSFVRGPSATLAYAKLVALKRAPRYIGHNPLGALMILALFMCIAVICGTGYLFGTDRFFGIGWVITTHLYATYTLFALIVMHLLGVIHASMQHRENLIAAMLHGYKRAGG